MKSRLFFANEESHCVHALMTGCTSSGYVHVSVVDAFAYKFKRTVPIECVYDRNAPSHTVNLFHMAANYAEV